MGGPVQIEPTMALLMCVHLAAGQVEYASQQVAAVPEDEAFEKAGGVRRLHPWARVQGEAMERLARFSKMALDAGVAEREIALAERYGAAIAGLLQSVLDGLGLSEEQRRRAPHLVREQMALITVESQPDPHTLRA